MLTVEQFVRALAFTESNDNPKAWGDRGRAMGRFQVHPDWWDTWQPKYGIRAKIGMTWDDWVLAVVHQFALNHLFNMQPLAVAMYFHLGHIANPSDDDWDVEYAARFSANAYQVSNA